MSAHNSSTSLCGHMIFVVLLFESSCSADIFVCTVCFALTSRFMKTARKYTRSVTYCKQGMAGERAHAEYMQTTVQQVSGTHVKHRATR